MGVRTEDCIGTGEGYREVDQCARCGSIDVGVPALMNEGDHELGSCGTRIEDASIDACECRADDERA
ncbi:unannotated protein [freshwater metagenome]|uniref:Unannotated protein n=1 Tax=freshwater metagenome TaxID=449393 RepID=A0A6J7NEA8_9ZZZZ